jgi:hypothetical protein
MKGGAFHRHNTGRPMVDSFGQTPLVHPYDQRWGAYVDFDHLGQTKPLAR